MKKGIILMLTAVVFSAVALVSCGEKFTPLTEDQISAKVDSLYNTQREAKLEELRAACNTDIDAKVNARFEAMKASAIASK